MVLQTSQADEGRLSRERTILTRIAAIIGNTFEADVCSIYELDCPANELVLAATVGLKQAAVQQIRMLPGEGLVGLVVEEGAPVHVTHAQLHARFKYFPEAGEEPYDSFLGVPISDDRSLSGVLVVQSIDDRAFSDEEQQRLFSLATSLHLVMAALPNMPNGAVRRPEALRDQSQLDELTNRLFALLLCLQNRTTESLDAGSVRSLIGRAWRIADAEVIFSPGS